MGLFLIYPLTGRLANRLKLDSARMQLVSTQERGSIPLGDFNLTKKGGAVMTDTIESNRKKFFKVRKQSFFKRRKCVHEEVFLGGNGIRKFYGCLKCGKESIF